MKLLVLTTQDQFFSTHVVERASFFLKNGWTVTVAFQFTNDVLVERVRSLGFEVFDTRIERQSINPFTQFAALYRLIKLYFQVMPDIVWHLGAKSIIYGTFVTRLVRFRKDVGIVNAPIGLGFVYASDSFLAKLLKPVVTVLYGLSLNPKGSKVIVENFDDLNYFVGKKFLKKKDAFCILGAGVNTKKFFPNFKRKKCCTVVMAARLIKEKGVWDYIKVAEMLYENHIQVKMLLVGEPDYGNPSSLSKQEFDMLKMNAAIDCRGFCSDMPKVLREADIFCLPSFYREGLPRALIEAASCGLVILTTDTIGCREVIRGNNGFLFKPHDVSKMYELITYLVSNQSEMLLMRKNSRRVAIEYFDTERICRRTLSVVQALYEEIRSRKDQRFN